MYASMRTKKSPHFGGINLLEGEAEKISVSVW